MNSLMNAMVEKIRANAERTDELRRSEFPSSSSETQHIDKERPDTAFASRIGAILARPDLTHHETLREILDLGCEVFGTQTGAVTKFDTIKSTVIVTNATTPNLNGVQQINAGSLHGRIARDQALICFRDRFDSRFGGLVDLNGKYAGSFLGKPVVITRQIYGAISFSSQTTRAKIWSSRDVARMDSITRAIESQFEKHDIATQNWITPTKGQNASMSEARLNGVQTG